MNKEQALNTFWNQFAPAFSQMSVPDERDFEEMKISPYPRITYEVLTDNYGAQNILNASIWDKNKNGSWKQATDILHAIEAALGLGGQTIKYDGGFLWVKRGAPFAQQMADTDDSIRRIAINVEVEFNSEV